MSKHDVIRLRHMIDAIDEAMAFVRGKDRKSLDQDRMLVLALIKDIDTDFDFEKAKKKIRFSMFPFSFEPSALSSAEGGYLTTVFSLSPFSLTLHHTAIIVVIIITT